MESPTITKGQGPKKTTRSDEKTESTNSGNLSPAIKHRLDDDNTTPTEENATDSNVAEINTKKLKIVGVEPPKINSDMKDEADDDNRIPNLVRYISFVYYKYYDRIILSYFMFAVYLVDLILLYGSPY